MSIQGRAQDKNDIIRGIMLIYANNRLKFECEKYIYIFCCRIDEARRGTEK